MTRHLILFLVCLVLVGLSVFHWLRGEYLALQVDLVLLAFAVWSWRPWRSYPYR